MADYLTEEVIAALDEETRTFVLATAVLGQFDAELCDRVLGRADSAARIAELERSNLFISRLVPGSLYRMHPLFADFASYQLAARSPDAVASIHRAAAAAHRAARRPIEAAEHAAAAGDSAMVGDVLAEHHLALLRAGRSRTLLNWARTLPDDDPRRAPRTRRGRGHGRRHRRAVHARAAAPAHPRRTRSRRGRRDTGVRPRHRVDGPGRDDRRRRRRGRRVGAAGGRAGA